MTTDLTSARTASRPPSNGSDFPRARQSASDLHCPAKFLASREPQAQCCEQLSSNCARFVGGSVSECLDRLPRSLPCDAPPLGRFHSQPAGSTNLIARVAGVPRVTGFICFEQLCRHGDVQEFRRMSRAERVHLRGEERADHELTGRDWEPESGSAGALAGCIMLRFTPDGHLSCPGDSRSADWRVLTPNHVGLVQPGVSGLDQVPRSGVVPTVPASA